MEVLSNPNALIPAVVSARWLLLPAMGHLPELRSSGAVCRGVPGRPACSARRGRRRHGGGAPEAGVLVRRAQGWRRKAGVATGWVPPRKASRPFLRGRSDARRPARSVDELPLELGSACGRRVVRGLSLGDPRPGWLRPPRSLILALMENVQLTFQPLGSLSRWLTGIWEPFLSLCCNILDKG